MTITPIPSIKQWFQLAVPNPTDKNRAVQLGCHFEEVAEQLVAISNEKAAATLSAVADNLKKYTPGFIRESELIDRLELLDGLCDNIVTAVGVAHMFGMDIEGALAEVNRSNFSKFVDGKPQFDENGKIMKPATFSKPDLAPYL